MNYGNRLKKLRKLFKRNRIDAICVVHPPNIRYLSGFCGEDSLLLVTADCCFILTDSRFEQEAKNKTPHCRLVLRKNKSLSTILAELSVKNRVGSMGVESNRITLAMYRGFSSLMGKGRVQPVTNLTESLRIIKDRGEVDLLKASCVIAADTVRRFKPLLDAGMTEKALQTRLEYEMKRAGAEKVAFDSIIASAPRSSMPHATASEASIGNRGALLVDAGCVYGGYSSDLTRCFSIGRISSSYLRIYDVVRKAQELGLKKARAGVRASEVDRSCRDYIRKQGYGSRFGHGTGHGVGLEVHEMPSIGPMSDTVLQPGMVITIEPGIYLPGRFGVRIEDTVLIKSGGCEVLTDGADKRL